MFSLIVWPHLLLFSAERLVVISYAPSLIHGLPSLASSSPIRQQSRDECLSGHDLSTRLSATFPFESLQVDDHLSFSHSFCLLLCPLFSVIFLTLCAATNGGGKQSSHHLVTRIHVVCEACTLCHDLRNLLPIQFRHEFARALNSTPSIDSFYN